MLDLSINSKVKKLMKKDSTSIQNLMSLGPKSEQMLAQIGIQTMEEFLAVDPFEVYRLLKAQEINIGLNGMYAMIAAHENISWLVVAKTQKEAIIMRLDDMGLAPK